MKLYRIGDVFWSWVLLFVVLMAVLVVTLCSDTLNAAPKICENPERCAQGLESGEAAPFKGMLLSTPLAIEQATMAHDCEEMVEIAVGAHIEPLQIKLEAEKQHRAVDNRASVLREDLLTKRLEEAQKSSVRRWWEDPRLWLGMGIVIGVGLTIGAVYGGVEIVKAQP